LHRAPSGVDKRIDQVNDVRQAKRIREPREGRLVAWPAPAIGQPPTGALKCPNGTRDIEIVGLLAAAANRERTRPYDV
jgi:hypothetical protein